MFTIRESEGKGRGLFATRKIYQGEVIERSPVIVIPPEELPRLENTRIFDYMFGWGPGQEAGAIVLGVGSICNHSYKPNTRYYRLMEERVIVFEAIADIEEGEEITVNYNGDPADLSPLWFEPAPEPARERASVEALAAG